MRRRRLPASAEDGKGMRMKRVRRGKGVDEDEDDLPSPLDDLHDPYVQVRSTTPAANRCTQIGVGSGLRRERG